MLASTSPYRAELLKRLGLQFQVAAPECEEKPLESEAAHDLVLRLSIEKARSLQLRYTNAWIIGSDQVAERDGHILGKPGNHALIADLDQPVSIDTTQLEQGQGVIEEIVSPWNETGSLDAQSRRHASMNSSA